MKGVIKIKNTEFNGSTIQAVNARDLHKYLESKRQFANWINDYLPDFELNMDYLVFNNSVKNPAGGRPSVEYAVSLDMAKHIALMSKTEKGKEIRKYFIECEKKLNRPMSQAELVQYSINKLIEIEKQTLENSEAIKKITAKQSAFEEGLSYFTIVGYAAYRGFTVDLSMAKSLGKKASKLSVSRGIPVDRTRDPRFGMVNSYHERILDEVVNKEINNEALNLT